LRIVRGGASFRLPSINSVRSAIRSSSRLDWHVCRQVGFDSDDALVLPGTTGVRGVSTLLREYVTLSRKFLGFRSPASMEFPVSASRRNVDIIFAFANRTRGLAAAVFPSICHLFRRPPLNRSRRRPLAYHLKSSHARSHLVPDRATTTYYEPHTGCSRVCPLPPRRPGEGPGAASLFGIAPRYAGCIPDIRFSVRRLRYGRTVKKARLHVVGLHRQEMFLSFSEFGGIDDAGRDRRAQRAPCLESAS